MVVYSLYKEGHNNCKKKKIGMFQTTLPAFLKAHGAQQSKEAEITGNKFQGAQLQQYLYCTAAKINNVYVSYSFSYFPSFLYRFENTLYLMFLYTYQCPFKQ